MNAFAGAVGPLLDGVLRGAALLAVATIVTFALRRRAAAERHAVWFVALVGVLVLPFAGAFAPSWRAPVLPEGLGGVAERLRAIEPAGGAEPIGPVDGAGPIEPAHGSGAAVVPGASRAQLAGGAAVPSVVESSARDAAAPASQPRRALRSRTPLGAWLGVGWAAGAALILLSIAFDRFRLVRLGRRARHAAPGSRLARVARALADDMEIPARPDVMIGAPGTMPMTWGIRRAVLLLPPEAETWSAARLDAVLRHELAHVRRRDYLTQLVGSLACAVHWFDPLAWFALARLRREREHACDDEVLATGAAPVTYAAELLHLARDRGFRGPVPASTLAVARPSQLEGRLRAVLDGTRRRARLTRRVLLRTTAAAACGLLPLAVIAPVPTRAAAPDWGSAEGPVHEGPSGGVAADGAPPSAEDVVRPREGASSAGRADVALSWLPERVPECLAMDRPASRRVNEHDGDWTISVRAAGCAFDLRLTRARAGGEPLDFDPAFRRIVGMETGSSLEIRSREEGVGTRRLAAEPDAGGRPVFRHWRDGTAAPFDEEAAEWLAGILVPVLRYTGFRARERTVYILEAGGASGLFQELDLIGSDRVQSLYTLAFVDEGAPDAAQLDALLDRTARLVGSDSRMREVLVGLVDRRPELARPPGWPAFRAAMGTVGSDSDHAALLLGLFDRAGSDPDVAANLLASARSEIGSDGDMALFLNRLAAERPDVLDGPSSREFWACVATIGSDGEMRAALLALADDHADPAVLQRILAAARAHIGSDSDMTSFLVAFRRRHDVEVAGPLREAYRAAAQTISSAGGLEQVLAAPSG